MSSPDTDMDWTTRPLESEAPAGKGGPAVQPVHTAVAGRSRYHVRGLKRSDPLKELIESGLSGTPGILSLSVNLLTGNILILHPKEVTSIEIALRLEALLAEPRAGGEAPRSSKVAAARSTGSVDRRQSAPPSRRKLREQMVKAASQQAEPWHEMKSEELAGLLQTSLNAGLTEDSLSERLRKYGPNLLPETVPRSGFSIFVHQFKTLPVLLLSASAALSVATGGIADAVVIMAVVGINAAIGYLTESQAEMTINSLKRLVHPTAVVVRGGKALEIRGAEVVPGDVLVLKPGSYVAADCRIVAAHQLTIDESALTGESLPVVKDPRPLAGQALPLADRLNMAYRGTLVTGGQGLAVVVGTGRYTEIGRVQELVGEAQSPKTPMEKQLDDLGNRLVWIGAGVCGTVFLLGLARGYGLLQMMKTSVSLAVAAIPEGLPAVATTTLALGIREMRRHKVLIRHLEAVETLGCVQTICLDKTGTLTFNRMSVVAVASGLQQMELRDGLFTGQAGRLEVSENQGLLRLVQVCALCNESVVERQDGDYVLHGSSTENALLQLALSSGIDLDSLISRFPLLHLTHRTESRNYMVSLHEPKDAGELEALRGDGEAATPRYLLAIKGSPLEVLAMCRWYLRDGERLPLTEADLLAIELNNDRLAGASLRVLGAACRLSDSEAVGEEFTDCTWLGLVGMADPIRPRVKELIGDFHGAGIDTLMITGDQVPTAYAIGKELDLSKGLPLEIFDSTRLQEIDPDLLAALAQKVQIFARVSPAQKLQIVQALQKGGRVVAMTGDGINDSPALKAADIGIAMGTAGTDVAREVADVVLEDDELETMVIAISHGRTIYGNIRKSVHYLLATNVSEIMVMFTALTLGLGQPLNPMQLLWINLLSDIFPALALALEPAEPDVLRRPPRDPQEPIIPTGELGGIALEGGILTAGALGAYLYGILRHGSGPRAGTLAFMSLTSSQLLHAVSCRSQTASLFDSGKLPPNDYLKWALLGSFGLQGCTLGLPGLRRLLGIEPLGLGDGLAIGGGALLPLLITEAKKYAFTGAKP